jgi:hypothetical protein
MKNLIACLTVGSVMVLSTFSSAFAIEASTVGSQTNEANVNVLNSKIDALMASLQAQVNGIITCNAQRKVYSTTRQ